MDSILQWDSVGDTAEMSQPLMHSWLPPTLSMHPMAGPELYACYDRRVMVWDKEVGDLWWSRLGQTEGPQG